MPHSRRSITALLLIGYVVILFSIVVFKLPFRVWHLVHPGREELAEGGRQGRGRGRGAARSFDGSENRTGGRAGPDPSALRDRRLSTSRFAPLHANYVPFKTILSQLRGDPRWSTAIMNLVGNTVLFMPVGYLVLLVCPRMRWQTSLVLALAHGVTMEVTEGVLRVGVVDIDDVILNALGVMGGCWNCKVRERRKETVLVQSA